MIIVSISAALSSSLSQFMLSSTFRDERCSKVESTSIVEEELSRDA